MPKKLIQVITSEQDHGSRLIHCWRYRSRTTAMLAGLVFYMRRIRSERLYVIFEERTGKIAGKGKTPFSADKALLGHIYNRGLLGVLEAIEGTVDVASLKPVPWNGEVGIAKA